MRLPTVCPTRPLSHPGTFKFDTLGTAPTTTAGPSETTPETGRALRDLVAGVSEAMAIGAFRPADPLTTALALWSAMHGVAALWTVTPNLPTDLAHVVGDLAQNAVLTGLAT